MAYIKNNWVDREGTTRYFETVDDDGALIFTPDYTQVTELGTPVNADNMNHIEEGIAAGSFTKFDLNTTYAKNDLVTVIEDGSPVIYKSLVDNNIGNALSDSAFWEKISLGGGGGLEIGDIGFTQMAIDEAKGKRRVLNGQLIIQDQYVQFTNIIKNSVALNPDLVCTEAEWQTAVTMSANGVCYKYVIDDEAGTIRLPKYPTYLDLSINTSGASAVSQSVSIKGDGKTLGLYNGSQTFGLAQAGNDYNFATNGYNVSVGASINASATTNNKGVGVTTDASKSGLTGSVTIPAIAGVKSEKIKGTYFIQVATGAETEDNIINKIELNNPYSLLDYKYSEYELNNLSWLCSNGQYKSKAVYPAVYDLLLKIYNGVETKAGVSVKLTTETFTDYDFVLNAAEETFRLPISVINSAQGYLYFYVGETVQNANLINAGRIEEKLVDKVDTNASNFTADGKSLISGWGMPSDKYFDLTLGASGTKYTAPANGWYVIKKESTASNQYLTMQVGTLQPVNYSVANQNQIVCYVPVAKGQDMYVYYNLGGKTIAFGFIYAQGEV